MDTLPKGNRGAAIASSDGPSPGRGPAIAVLIAAAIAIAAASYLLHAYLRKTYGAEVFDSVCSINETFDCDKISTSSWGKLFDTPITVFAIPTWLALAALAILSLGRSAHAVGALQVLRLGAALALAYGLLLFYVMVAIERTYCLFCLTMDVAAAVALAASHLGLRQREGQPFRLIAPSLLAVLVGLISLGVTWQLADGTRRDLLAAQLSAADKAMADADATRAALAAQPKEAGAATAQRDELSPPVAAGAAAGAGTGKARKLSESLYEIPVHPDDASVGPADANVTLIEYADFQCGYCKKLFYVMQTLKKRYDGKVRFVFKHFPMNTLCNAHIQNNRHKWACNAALASECARRQGKFWPMHDIMFKNQHKLESTDLRHYATGIGLDMDAYTACMRDPTARDALKRSIDEAGVDLGLRATPRTFLNGLMLSGALPEEVLSKMIDTELQKAGMAPTPVQVPISGEVAPPSEAKAAWSEVPKVGMVALTGPAGKRSYIDRYEASLDGQGRALSLAGVVPASASWYEAKAACEKAGKRLCNSAEWASACTGQPAFDDDSNGNYLDDYVEGNQFPYADFHEPGHCNDDGDRVNGKPQETGALAHCRTTEGVFDLAGNVEEWVEPQEDKAQLAGGDFRAGDKASCVRAHRSYGPGHHARGVGFRCCADRDVPNASAAAVAQAEPAPLVDKPAPDFDFLGRDGSKRSLRELRGKVVFVTFFASWCSPCRRELPELNEFKKKYGDKGFEIIAIGVDTDPTEGRSFVAGVGALDYEVDYDPKSLILGRFDVANMPTGYVIDRKGVIRFRSVGYGDTSKPLLQAELEKWIAVR